MGDKSGLSLADDDDPLDLLAALEDAVDWLAATELGPSLPFLSARSLSGCSGYDSRSDHYAPICPPADSREEVAGRAPRETDVPICALPPRSASRTPDVDRSLCP